MLHIRVLISELKPKSFSDTEKSWNMKATCQTSYKSQEISFSSEWRPNKRERERVAD